MSIKVINYEVEDMGWLFKQSKKRYQWTFMLEDSKHILELEFSYLSGKRKLVLDGKVLYESIMITSSFQYPFTLEGFGLNVIQQGDTFELRINNKDFSHIFNQNKTRVAFKNDENEPENNRSLQPSDYNPVLNNNFQNNPQKINLNIKFENQKDINHIYQKPHISQQMKSSTTFGQPGAFDEFESFSKVQMTTNPFENSFQVQGFSAPQTTQIVQQQQKIDLLNIDDDIPQQQSNNGDVNPEKYQNSQQTQQQNLFEDFASSWNQQEPQLYQKNLFQQSNQIQQPFNSFNLDGQVGEIGQKQQVGIQGQQVFESNFPKTSQQQQNINILNLYGNSQPVVGNLAYSAFPQIHTQPIPQSQPTPFDLFR